MKAIIESKITKKGNAEEFVRLINQIVISESENQLRKNVSEMYLNFRHTNFAGLEYGFGSSHMWVHEKGNSERLLIVEF